MLQSTEAFDHAIEADLRLTTIERKDKWVRVQDGAYHSEGWDVEPYWLVTFDDGAKADLPCHYGRDELVNIAGETAVSAFMEAERLANVKQQNTLLTSLFDKVRESVE